MNALVLGGQSPRHQAWVRQVAEALQPHFSEVKYIDYRHWPEDNDIDAEYELAQASALAGTFIGEYVIIAKSIGSVITVRGVARHELDPKRCVFLGLPLKVIRNAYQDVGPSLSALPPTVIVQNTHDPVGAFEQVDAFTAEYGNKQMAVVETPGDTHDYVDVALIARFAARLS